jgi:hypothetical protein
VVDPRGRRLPRYAEYQQKTDRVIPIVVLEQVS